MYLLKRLRNDVIDFFEKVLVPAYDEAKARSGFRWDTLERRGGTVDQVDISIKARMGWAYLIFAKAIGAWKKPGWIQEAEIAAAELMALQEADGRWENPYKRPESSLEDTFTTCDAIQFLSRMDKKDNAEKGAQWLLHGEVMEQYLVSPGPPLSGLLSFRQANHVGSILRALVVTGHIKESQAAAMDLCGFQRPCGSWQWSAEDHKISTNYHDLTMAGTLDVWGKTLDLRLKAPILQGLEYVWNMQSPAGLLYDRYDEITGQKSNTWYSGITSLALAHRETLLSPQQFNLLAGLIYAVMDRSPLTLKGFYTSNVENRLVVLRGLSDFIEATS